MGIDGLLTLLKPLIKKQHISAFRQQTLAIDALPWIYKGIYGANLQMGQNMSEGAFLYYIIEMIDMLEFYKIKPIFVFDGKSLQAKYKTLQKRKKAKQQNKKKAQEQLQKNEIQNGKKTMARCINIDEAKLVLVMRLLKQKNIDFVIAPYQADSQICKLFKLGKIKAVITQDSDLVIYGVDVILKLKQTGQCDYLTLKKTDKQEITQIQCSFLRNFCKFTPQKRIQSAILAGCDYVNSIKGIGIKKAIKLVEQNQGFSNIIQSLSKDGKFAEKIPSDYIELVSRAKLIFIFAKTFNPSTNQLQCLSKELEDQIKQFGDNKENIQKIVGQDYQFTQKHYFGVINCKTQEQRKFEKFNFKQIYNFNRQNIGFEVLKLHAHQSIQQDLMKSQKNDKQIKQIKQLTVQQAHKIRQAIIDETTSICWQEDSRNECFEFLLQNDLIAKFFMLIEGQSQLQQSL